MSDQKLPDVALESDLEKFPKLAWVGMKEIEVPLLMNLGGEKIRLPARVEAMVSLDKQASRGIHMSRLYMIVQDRLAQEALNFKLMKDVTGDFLKSHQDLASNAKLSLRFDLPLRRQALKSANQAWRNYPVTMSVVNSTARGTQFFLEVLVTYSSTCPASAALSRQLIQDHFSKSFPTDGSGIDFTKMHEWLGSTNGIIATPHAQRSLARVKVQVRDELAIEPLIDWIEEALQTAVQGAVKREDEQEFALRNGQNLMFCEDAARRVKRALDQRSEVEDYIAELNHVESLHPHNAVSIVTKGLELDSF